MIVEPVVEAETAVLEPARRLEAALVAQRDQQLVLVLRPGRDRPALAGRHLLVRVEGPDRRMAVRAERPPFVARPQSLARVLDERQAVLVADRAQLVELAWVAEDVDRDDRLRALGDRRLDGRRIEVERVRIDVGEDRRRAFVDRAVRRSDERVRRRDHLVARPDAGEPHAEMQAGRPR